MFRQNAKILHWYKNPNFLIPVNNKFLKNFNYNTLNFKKMSQEDSKFLESVKQSNSKLVLGNEFYNIVIILLLSLTIIFMSCFYFKQRKDKNQSNQVKIHVIVWIMAASCVLNYSILTVLTNHNWLGEFCLWFNNFSSLIVFKRKFLNIEIMI